MRKKLSAILMILLIIITFTGRTYADNNLQMVHKLGEVSIAPDVQVKKKALEILAVLIAAPMVNTLVNKFLDYLKQWKDMDNTREYNNAKAKCKYICEANHAAPILDKNYECSCYSFGHSNNNK